MEILADDNNTSLLHSEKRFQLVIQNDINSMGKGFVCKKLSINTSKCETISFGCKKPAKLNIAGVAIPDKPFCKYLGDPILNFHEYTSYIGKNRTNSVD